MRNARTVTTVVGNQRIDDSNGSATGPIVAAAVGVMRVRTSEGWKRMISPPKRAW